MNEAPNGYIKNPDYVEGCLNTSQGICSMCFKKDPNPAPDGYEKILDSEEDFVGWIEDCEWDSYGV